MKIKEIIEMSTDELLTKKRDLRQESLHSAIAATERSSWSNPAGCVCSDARWPGSGDGAFQTDEGDEIIFMAEEPSTSVPPPLPTSAPSSAATAPQSQRGSRKTRVGEVISSGMNKTIVVRHGHRVPHPKFGKIVKQQRNLRSRRREQSEERRHRSHHGNAAPEQIETVAFGRNRRK